MRKLLIALFLCLSLFLPTIFAGKAVIAGGAVSWKNEDLFDEFVNMVGTSRGYVGVITAGTTLSIARSTANDIASQLRNRYGIKTVEWLPYHPNNGSTCRSTAWNSKLTPCGQKKSILRPFDVGSGPKLETHNFSFKFCQKRVLQNPAFGR